MSAIPFLVLRKGQRAVRSASQLAQLRLCCRDADGPCSSVASADEICGDFSRSASDMPSVLAWARMPFKSRNFELWTWDA